MSRKLFFLLTTILSLDCAAQLKWVRVDSLFGELPDGVHVYRSNDSINGRPNIAFYVEADLRNRHLFFDSDTTLGRRFTPQQFYDRNNRATIVVNCTFFSFATHQNLGLVMREGKLISYNQHSLPGRGKDTLTYRHPLGSAIGIDRKRRADVAWLYTDSSARWPHAFQRAVPLKRDSVAHIALHDYLSSNKSIRAAKWRMKTAVAGGPVLLQDGEVSISNNEEWKFVGNAVHDLHPRTGMGYTRDRKLIILAVEGRNPGRAGGISLEEEAIIFRDLGCVEALNLDGGGSSCLLVNGKETIRPSDKSGQRPVPAVFMISQKR